MYSIATTSTLGSNDSNNRLVLVEVKGAVHKQVHTSNYTIKVPFNRLSQTIQRIGRTGGKVVNVTMSLIDISENEINTEVSHANTELEATLQSIEVLPPIEIAVDAVQELSSVETTSNASTAKATSGKTRSFGKKTAEKSPKNTKRAKKPRS